MKRVSSHSQIDPRAKIVIVLIASTLAILINDVYFLLGLLVLTLAALIAFGVKPIAVYPKVRRFVPLFLALILLQSIFSPSGPPLIVVRGITVITTGGIITGISVILRMFVVIACAMILTTSPPLDIIMALVKFRIPYEIAFMVLLGIRFLPILTGEFRDALTAIQLRGVRIDRIPAGQRLRIYSYILMPVVAGAVLRAKKVATSMEARAFRAYPKRTYMHDLAITGKDYAVMFSAVALGVSYYIAYIVWG